MTILRLQVARIRHGILTPAEQPRELTSADRQILSDNHRRRLAEIVSKQCAQALKHVQNHKVGDVRSLAHQGVMQQLDICIALYTLVTRHFTQSHWAVWDLQSPVLLCSEVPAVKHATGSMWVDACLC